MGKDSCRWELFGRSRRASTNDGIAAVGRVAWLLAIMVLATAALAQPSPRFYVDMVYVPQVGKVLVFGGKDDENVPWGAADTIWWWDPADGSWESAAAADGPSPRGGVAIAVHQPTGTVVLFGGSHGTRAGLLPNYTDTWLLHPDTGVWERLDFEPGHHPERAFGRALEYHAASDLFVLFGGWVPPGRFYNDVWHFDLAARRWVKVAAADPPRGRNYIGWTYDPGSERVLMYGQPDDDVRDFAVYAYDPVGQAWTRGEAELDPGGIDYFLRMVYDHDSGSVVRWGGTGDDAGTAWLYDPKADEWRPLETGEPAPARRSRHAMTSVPGVGVVVFGGALTGLFQGRDLVNELWVLDVVEGRWEQR